MKIFENEKFWDRKFSKIFRSEKIENFHSKLYEKWKILRSKKIENLGQKKSEVEEVRETFWYLFFIESFRIKSIRPGNVFSFHFQRDFGVNINTRKIKKGFALVWHRIKEFYTYQDFRGPISWNHTLHRGLKYHAKAKYITTRRGLRSGAGGKFWEFTL